MSAAGVPISLPRVRAMPAEGAWRWVVLAFVSTLSATFWAFTRFPMAGGFHGWASKRCVTLEMQPGDWPCRVTMGRSLTMYLIASAFVSLAVLVPTVVLALKGRRLLAFVPMLAPLAITLLSHLATWAWSGSWVSLEHTSTSQIFLGPFAPWTASEPIGSAWRPDHPVAIGADLLLLGIPVLALIALVRPRKAARLGFSARSALLALCLAGGASVIVEWASNSVVGGTVYLEGGWFLQGLAIVSFGLLLPNGSRRPLWTIPVVACLLSLGAPAAIAGSIYDDGLTTFTFFRSALPLTLMGLAAAASTAFVARRRGLSIDDPIGPRPRFRRASIGYGCVSAALAIVTLMAALDPLPYAISTALPTYLGAADRVRDLRSRLTLEDARRSASAYRATRGSFDGFGAAVAREEASSLLWADGLPPRDATFGPELTVHVLPVSDDRIRLVLVGPVTTYCLRITAGQDPTYGLARTGSPRERAEASAATCGHAAWAPELLRPFPVDDLCDAVAEVILCRSVQQRLRATLASPTGIV